MELLSQPGSGNSALPEELPEGTVLIDVRSPAEFNAGHIRNAIPLPLVSLGMVIDRVVPERTSPIVVYCQSGARSAFARQQLLDLGYRNVTNGGGIQALAQRIKREIVS